MKLFKKVKMRQHRTFLKISLFSSPIVCNPFILIIYKLLPLSIRYRYHTIFFYGLWDLTVQSIISGISWPISLRIRLISFLLSYLLCVIQKYVYSLCFWVNEVNKWIIYGIFLNNGKIIVNNKNKFGWFSR